MKSGGWVMILIVVAALSFLVGYSLAPRDAAISGAPVSTDSAGYGSDSGGYGSEDSGGYGTDTGGYGVEEDTGGYGVPDTGGYGQ
jgi:hypothetical protein